MGEVRERRGKRKGSSKVEKGSWVEGSRGKRESGNVHSPFEREKREKRK